MKEVLRSKAQEWPKRLFPKCFLHYKRGAFGVGARTPDQVGWPSVGLTQFPDRTPGGREQGCAVLVGQVEMAIRT
uniref:HDC15090 n=1 Tax=Drosophila melanogaster TaxID=7227 RepID=Q6IJE3_DROME|nr:TPA_inf: HDC15090 [Drosophila melanogaster]